MHGHINRITLVLATTAFFSCGDGGSSPGDADAELEDAGTDSTDAQDDVADLPEGDGRIYTEETYTEEREPCSSYEPLRQVFFGDLHAHSGYSFDAWGYGNRHDPGTVYDFARGESITLPPLDASGTGTRETSIERPLDFVMVSDHSEFLGEVLLCTEPGHPAYDGEDCVSIRDDPSYAVVLYGMHTATLTPARMELCPPEDSTCIETAAMERWQLVQAAAESHYDRSASCEFVTFVGYEYTATPQVSNNHRNVVFRNGVVPELPTSYYEAQTSWELWSSLEEQCIDAATGCDVMTIAHNENLSNGTMYTPDYPGFEEDYAALMARMEPIAEIFQHKGDAECRNGLEGVNGEHDPLCDFEKLRPPGSEDCGDGTGTGGMRLWGCVSRLDFVRNILKEGLSEESRIGVNPYRIGVIGATDTHNATAGKVEEWSFPGHIGTVDDTPLERLGEGTLTHDGVINNPGGLAAVWAEEKSRDAIFDALRRREVYGTSGTRITVRLFGGWEYPASTCDDPSDLASVGYAGGVPMGGVLPAGTGSPTFVVRATADPLSAPLRMIQIVKGWIAADGSQWEKVFDVAGDPSSGAGVDLDTCVPSGEGFDSLCAVWTDPEFDPSLQAFYYARVVENPTCRWSVWECNALDEAERPPVCDDGYLAGPIMERAWTSAIWYSP